MKAPNTLLEDAINKITYVITITCAQNKERTSLNREAQSPLWITGMFRSGTSITTQIVEKLGISLGPSQDLLQAKGSRAKLNPNGFFENYLFMEWSLYIFKQLNAWGDLPPSLESVQNFDMSTIDYRNFVYNAIVINHDDRISNFRKLLILRNYNPQNLSDYLRTQFKPPFALKNPHFMLLHPLLDSHWPSGKYLIVFRNPQNNLKSAKNVSPRVTIQLYYQYYSRLIDHKNALFFNFDLLLQSPKHSIEKLALALNSQVETSNLAAMVETRNSNDTMNTDIPQNVSELYNRLTSKAINRV